MMVDSRELMVGENQHSHEGEIHPGASFSNVFQLVEKDGTGR